MANCIEIPGSQAFRFAANGYITGEIRDADGNRIVYNKTELWLYPASCTTRRDLRWFIRNLVMPLMTNPKEIYKARLRDVADEYDGFDARGSEPLYENPKP